MTMGTLARQTDADELARLKALRALGVLDTEPEPRIQAFIEHVARTFEAPMAALSFIDSDRVWIKAAVGLQRGELPRSVAICGHVVNAGSMLVVSDTLADARFACNALVVNPPHIRFYAGVALRSASGHVVGALCLLDVVPRRLEPGDRRHLASMADYLASELIVREFVSGMGCFR